MSKLVQIGKQVVYNGELKAANTPFEIEDKHFKHLQKAGAWEVDQQAAQQHVQVELGDRTVAELKELAQDLGITVKRGMTKSTLVSAIVEAQEALDGADIDEDEDTDTQDQDDSNDDEFEDDEDAEEDDADEERDFNADEDAE